MWNTKLKFIFVLFSRRILRTLVKTAKVMISVKCLYPCIEFSVLEWRISPKPIFSDFSKIVILARHLLSHLSLIYTVETSSNQYILPLLPPPPLLSLAHPSVIFLGYRPIFSISRRFVFVLLLALRNRGPFADDY